MPDIQTPDTIAKKRNIFDIDAELDSIAMAFDQLAETGEEAAVLEAIENYFGSLLDERDRKLDGYARLIDQYASIAKIRKAEADRIAALATTDENNAKRLKARLKLYFESNEISKIETKLHKFAIQGNGGVQPLTVSSDVEEDATLLPKEFQKVIPDTDKIRAELGKPEKEQNAIVVKYCVLEPRGTHLRVK